MVYAPEEVQLKRLMARDKISEESGLKDHSIPDVCGRKKRIL